MNDCPNCEYHRKRAQRWRDEAYKLSGHPLPEQEPVAWISATELLVMRGNALGGAKDWRVNLGLEPEEGDVGLFTIPPPVAEPHKRTWVNATTWRGLTDEEILSISADCASSHQHMDIQFARAIEAKLKAKNSL